jgi:hypothetical protein
MSFQSYFQDALFSYNSLGAFDVDSAIRALDVSLQTYSQEPSDEHLRIVKQTFEPIAQYYAKLTDIHTHLQKYLKKSSKYVVDSQDTLLQEERYENKVHPEESMKSREFMYGIFPSLRATSLPFLLSASVFMACMSLFMIFQMAGVTGHLSLPPSVVEWWNTPAIGVSFYHDPMIMGGLAIVFSASTILFAVLYFKSKNPRR